VLKEVMAYYEVFLEGKDLVLPSPRPYAEYISWLEQQDAPAAETYWRSYLKGFETPTPLPLESSREPGSGEQQVESVLLSRDLTRQLRTFGVRNRVTFSSAIQGLWGLVLSVYSGITDVVFGVTSSGRPADLAGSEGMVGLMINTLPVRVKVSPDHIARDWLADLLAHQAASQHYGHASLVQIKNCSEVLASLPLFESLIVVENYALDAFEQEYAEGRAVLNSGGL